MSVFAYNPDELLGTPADGDRAKVMAKLQLLLDWAQDDLTQWAARALPEHDADVQARAVNAGKHLKALARFAQQVAKVLPGEIEGYEEQQFALLGSIQVDADEVGGRVRDDKVRASMTAPVENRARS